MGSISKIIMGLPTSGDIESATDAAVAIKLRSWGFKVVEANSFRVLLPLLLSSEPYLGIIHTDILDLFDATNFHRATIIKLAGLLNYNPYRLWDPRDRWEVPIDGGGNLDVWKVAEDQLVIKILNLVSAIKN